MKTLREITDIQRYDTKPDGQRYLCGWGTRHEWAEDCLCWDTYGYGENMLFRAIRNVHPNVQTSSQFTPVMIYQAFATFPAPP